MVSGAVVRVAVGLDSTVVAVGGTPVIVDVSNAEVAVGGASVDVDCALVEVGAGCVAVSVRVGVGEVMRRISNERTADHAPFVPFAVRPRTRHQKRRSLVSVWVVWVCVIPVRERTGELNVLESSIWI